MTEPNDATIDQPGRANPHEQETVLPSGSAVELAGILDQYMADLQAGKAPDRAQLLAAHPDLTAQLEGCLPGIEFIHRATGAAAKEPENLGEFRIVREIGRGGMGVVYEAEQTSLRRRVALKVLRFGVVADQEAMQRFRREAETVARLHHTNIVPIFAIGCERGVHYYAMQLIEGRSLADVLDESQRTGKPLKADDVARWGLQAAEALAHAHQRGVIHRDIKPSNLLIDNEGVVWLTDFGLAKRAGEVTLTVSGTLMGTPRYMSPEQAESLQRTIDHRTDLYSLGASLYELATGRPVFESATPHGVVMQILTEEPARPRQIRPDLPRDLETIILTCLAKDPGQRYQTARALADDLRAVLAGGPIQARRVPLGERVARYVRKRRKTITITAIAAAATVLLIAGTFLGWRYYTEWRLGQVVLTTDGPPLRAEVLPESGDEPIGEPFDLVTRATFSLPAADYRLRVKGDGLLGQTFRFGVNRGETQTHPISLDDNRLLGTDAIPYAFATEALVLSPGKADLVEWTGQTLIRRDGVTGKPIWDASRPAKPWEPNRDPVAWIRRLSYLGDEKRPGPMVQPAPDLDGDGTGDIVWAFRGTPSFLALSGKDGSMLWTYTADVDGPGGPDPGGPAWPQSIEQVPKAGQVLGTASAWDADGDGVPDVIAAFDVRLGSSLKKEGLTSFRQYGLKPPGRPVVIVAVSGRSGRALWRYAFDWDLRKQGIDLALGEIGVTLIHGRRESIVAFHGDTRWIGLDPASGKPRGQPIDLTTGDRKIGRWFPVIPPVQYADLDGDGSPEAIVLGGNQSPSTLAAFSLTTGKIVWQEVVWTLHPSRGGSLEIEWPVVANSEWPLVADLDGDGRAEIAIPDVGSIPPGKGKGPVSAPPGTTSLTVGNHYGGVRLLDGATGQTRWIHPLQHDKTQFWRYRGDLAHLIVGPDLNGDGTNEIVVVSRFTDVSSQPTTSYPIYVDALSGKDGSLLWWWHTVVEDHSLAQLRFVIWPPRWWGRGPDGWPMLLVPLGGNLPGAWAQANPEIHPEPAVAHLLTASTGRESHVIPGLSWPKPADLDGDGLNDLWGSVGGKLRAIRGETPEAWRALGQFDQADDLDGDGVPDVLSRGWRKKEDWMEAATIGPIAVARSGSNGKLLWRRALDPLTNHQYTTFPLPSGDLDGDGAPDVVVTDRPGQTRNHVPPSRALPLQVLSGRSGRPIWSAGSLPMEPEAFAHKFSGREIESFDPQVCEIGGPPDFLVLHSRYWQTDKELGKDVHGVLPARAFSGADSVGHWQVRFSRLSGRDGRVKWDHALVERESPRLSTSNARLPDVPQRQYGDLDGGGGLDAILDVILESTRVTGKPDVVRSELRAISLRDGKTRWSYPIRSRSADAILFQVGDLDGDGRAEVVLIDEPSQKDQAAFELAVLDGRDGSTRWTWRGSDLDQRNLQPPPLRLVDFQGKGQREVCLNVGLANGRRRVVILDAKGRELVRRELGPGGSSTLESADLDGDGREELLLQYDGKLRACRDDFGELWSWPSRELIREILPARGGQSATVVINPMVGLDGATGRPRWAGHSALAVLVPSVAPSLPRLLTGSADTTIYREALPTTPEGAFQQARGTLAKAHLARDDPRWERSLPWADLSSERIPYLFLSMGGLALVNLIIPLVILRLATRKRIWGVRLLLALPVVVAIPAAAYRWWPGFAAGSLDGASAVVRLWDVDQQTLTTGFKLLDEIRQTFGWFFPITIFSLITLAGIPFAVFAIVVGSSLAHRSWKRLLWLFGLTALSSAVVVACWLWWDMRGMMAIEHYTWSGWYTIALLGAYTVGVLAVIAWTARGLFRFVRRLGRRKAAVTPLLSERQ